MCPKEYIFNEMYILLKYSATHKQIFYKSTILQQIVKEKPCSFLTDNLSSTDQAAVSCSKNMTSNTTSSRITWNQNNSAAEKPSNPTKRWARR